MSFSSKRLQTTSSSKPSKYIQTSNELSLSTKGLQPSNPSNLMTGSVYTSNQNSNLNHHVLSGNGNNNSGPDHAYGPEVINHGFEWTDDDYDHFIDCIIEFKGHIPSSRTVIKKWMDIRTSFMAYVRRIRPHLNYNPEWQDLQKSYKMNRKEFAKEFDIKFNDFYHANNFGTLKAKMEGRPWQIKMLEMEADRYQAFVMIPPHEAKHNWKAYCKKRMAEIKVRDQEKGSYYGLGFIYGMMEDSFLAFMMMSFGLCFIDIILVGVGAGASQIFNFGPSYFPSSQPTMAPFSVNITVTPSMEPTLGNSYHSFQRPFTYELQILVISASIITFLWGYFATVRFFPPDYKWKKAIGKRMRRVIDFMCCRKESSKIVPEEIDKEELKSNDPYLVYKKDTSHLASNTLHEVTVVPSYQVMLARMWMCLDKQCTLELFIYIFSIVFFAYGQYGLASLRVLRMYRYLTYFNYLEVDQDEDIPKERLQFSLVKAAKICGFYMDQLYYEFFTQKSMGGSLVMVLFFFNAYVMAVVMHIQKGYVLTGADFVTQPCVTLNMCFLTMIRLAVYDGSGLDFVAAILDEGSDGFVFMLMFYAVLNALILFNGLIGIFANTFTENDETADTTLGEIIELDANVRYFHEETKKKMNEMQNFLVDFVTKFEQINGNYGSGNGNDNHQHTGRSQVTAQHRGSGTYMHHSAAHIVTDGPSYRRNSRTNSVSTAKSRHNSDATEIFNPYSDKYVNSTDNSIRSQGSVTNPLIQSALTTSPRSGVDTHTESGMTQSDLNQSDLNQSEGDIAMINSSVQEADPPVKKLLSKLLPPLSVAPQQAPVPVPVPVVDKQQAIPVMSSVTSATTTATTNTNNKSSGSSSSGGVLSLDVSDSPGHKDGKKKLSLLNKLV